MKPGEFVPCPQDQVCGNCPHPMALHWTIGTHCRAEGCRCSQWFCKHGGGPA